LIAQRKELRGESIPKDFIQHSYNFITEELAVFAMQSRHLPAVIHITNTLMTGGEGGQVLLKLIAVKCISFEC
ncbi:MAG: hypothetical protein FWE93_07295, partial [Alphaproteobacteria bacterium]|nr:hypothetical protein [Alphaproteobacteria bacterium]